MRTYKKILLFSLLASLSYPSFSAASSQTHILVTPRCLLKNIEANYQTLAVTQQLKLIATTQENIEVFINEKNKHKKQCGGFMDVTRPWSDYSKQRSSTHNAANFLAKYTIETHKALQPTAYSIKHPEQVAFLIKQSNPQYMWTRLESLTNYENRYADSNLGVQAANDIKTEIETMAKNNNRQDVSAYFVPTSFYKQPSVVVKIGTSDKPGIVIGAHMDTLSSKKERKPGADDDGSGTVTVLEVARTLISSGMQFDKPVYLIWYAAEEMGLVGSQDVVTYFKNQKIAIDAVLQLDMTGYSYKNDSTMFLYDDFTDKELTHYLETLINTYVKAPIKHDKCRYACSDHASWTFEGFSAAFPFEGAFDKDNPNIHTAEDTMDKLSLNHMTNFVKLALAFVGELADPIV